MIEPSDGVTPLEYDVYPPDDSIWIVFNNKLNFYLGVY